ncbi:MAG: class I SAM-dependent methyltransferase [Endomicrobiales bacterium]|nr:class I SAM-dependent methyltransferase [Endomicrobiales bacterium]
MKKYVSGAIAKIFEMLSTRVWRHKCGGMRWEDDKWFMDAFREIQKKTLVSVDRLFLLYYLAKRAKSIPGSVAEVGVYKGGTARLISGVYEGTDKKIYLFDTFEGMPDTDKELDWHRKGVFGDTSVESVRKFLSGRANVEVHKGYFPQSSNPTDDKKFCFVHIDVDIYASVRKCCEYFYGRMEKGGLMVLDDYGFISCPGAKKAVDEFMLGKPDIGLYLQTGQYVIIKA